MHSIRTYLLQALADPAARGSAQFGDAALDGRLSVAGPLSGTPPASPESTFCAPETAYACWSSGHSYSAIWAAGDRSHHCPKDRASVRLRASGSYLPRPLALLVAPTRSCRSCCSRSCATSATLIPRRERASSSNRVSPAGGSDRERIAIHPPTLAP